jgi:hypothetical protein
LNRRIELLQSSALPLGYRALMNEAETVLEKNGGASAEMSLRRVRGKTMRATGFRRSFHVSARIGETDRSWHDHAMQNAVIFASLVSGLIFAVATVMTCLALRRARDGYQDENGFHSGAEPVVAAPSQFSDSVVTWSDNDRHSGRPALAA